MERDKILHGLVEHEGKWISLAEKRKIESEYREKILKGFVQQNGVWIKLEDGFKAKETAAPAQPAEVESVPEKIEKSVEQIEKEAEEKADIIEKAAEKKAETVEKAEGVQKEIKAPPKTEKQKSPEPVKPKSLLPEEMEQIEKTVILEPAPKKKKPEVKAAEVLEEIKAPPEAKKQKPPEPVKQEAPVPDKKGKEKKKGPPKAESIEIKSGDDGLKATARIALEAETLKKKVLERISDAKNGGSPDTRKPSAKELEKLSATMIDTELGEIDSYLAAHKRIKWVFILGFVGLVTAVTIIAIILLIFSGP
jgi:hypothetical protein